VVLFSLLPIPEEEIIMVANETASAKNSGCGAAVNTNRRTYPVYIDLMVRSGLASLED